MSRSKNEREYWNQRYTEGGDSGLCSVGKLREWRHKIIKKNVSLKDKSLLDVGCGDLRFWEGFDHKDYTGLDISTVIIERNKLKYPDWTFYTGDASQIYLNRWFDVVFCFEMLFHVMTEESFIRILKNINCWTRNIAFVTCWSERPVPFVFPHYQAHYQLEDYLHHIPDLVLKRRYTTKKGLRALYVFQRGENND